MEYELTVSPVHLTTTDECILSALRKLATLDQQVSFDSLLIFLNFQYRFQIAQLIRDNQMYLFEPQNRSCQQEEDPSHDLPEDTHKNLLDAHNKTVVIVKFDLKLTISIFCCCQDSLQCRNDRRTRTGERTLATGISIAQNKM